MVARTQHTHTHHRTPVFQLAKLGFRITILFFSPRFLCSDLLTFISFPLNDKYISVTVNDKYASFSRFISAHFTRTTISHAFNRKIEKCVQFHLLLLAVVAWISIRAEFCIRIGVSWRKHTKLKWFWSLRGAEHFVSILLLLLLSSSSSSSKLVLVSEFARLFEQRIFLFTVSFFFLVQFPRKWKITQESSC